MDRFHFIKGRKKEVAVEGARYTEIEHEYTYPLVAT